MVSSISQIQPLPEEELVYNSLHKLQTYERPEPIPVCIGTQEEKISKSVLGILGSGGSKRAYELEGGTALLMPCIRSLSLSANCEKWEEKVDEEIMATTRVRELGLLACHLEKTQVFMTPESTISVVAYQTDTFQQLSTRGIWIIDQKDSLSSTWRKRSFFAETTDRFDETNWEKLLNPFLRDIAKLLAKNFYLYIDNVNIAVLERPMQDDGVNYEVRYFGFDFSSKYGQLSFKKLSSEEVSSLVPSIVGDALMSLMDCEFARDWSEKRRVLYQSLREKCIKQILSDWADHEAIATES